MGGKKASVGSIDPEVQRRLDAIRNRDLEKLTEDQMNRYVVYLHAFLLVRDVFSKLKVRFLGLFNV